MFIAILRASMYEAYPLIFAFHAEAKA